MDTEKKSTENRTMENIAVSLGSKEVVYRYGSANAEYIKGYTGVDHETGQIFHKGLKKIAKSKVNPDYQEQNIKQQAGFSAEIAKTSRDNAENIINKVQKRTIRTEDHKDFGLNDTVYDHVETIGGEVIQGSGSQMKFVKKPEQLLDKIATGDGGGKNDLSRYKNAKLDLPSDQVDTARQYCKTQAEKFRRQAERLKQNGKHDLALKKEQQAANYDKLSDNIRDSGITSEEAKFYRKHPALATTIDIGKVSHRAGVEAAKHGAIIGGTISTAKNIVALIQNDKELGDALYDITIDTGKSAALAYGTGAVGAAAKSFMQQAKSNAVRQLSRTSLPTLAVTVCLELTTSIQRYANGQIDGVQLMEELGEKGSGMLASGMMATVGQIAIPIPIVGAVIGGMIGYTLSSLFYQSSLAAFQSAKQAKQEHLHIKASCEAARSQMQIYQNELRAVFDEHLADTRANLANCFVQMDQAILSHSMDTFAAAGNALGLLVGKSLRFESMEEFEEFMASDDTLIL